jgi:hypothetical protein
MGIYTDVSLYDLGSYGFSNYASYAPGSDTLMNSMNAPANIVVLKKGLGQVAGYYSCHFECIYYEHLEAYRKGNDTVGVFTTDGVLLGLSPETIAEFSAHVYPSPANDQITVEWQNAEPVELILIDLQGRTVRSFGKYNGMARLDVSGITDGVYFLQLRSGSRAAAAKVVISH